MSYPGRNVVATNRSSSNHGRPATLHIRERGGSVELCHGLRGGNQYGISLAKDESLADAVAELIGYCPKVSLPKLLGAIGEVIARP